MRPTVAQDVLYYPAMVNTWQVREAHQSSLLPTTARIAQSLRAMIMLLRRSDAPGAGRAVPGRR